MSCAIDTDQCIACDCCWEECPNDAISEDEETGYYLILPEECDCCDATHDEPQCKQACPIEDAIYCDCWID